MRQRGRDRVKEVTLRKGRPRFVVFIMCDDVACGWGTPRSACGRIAGGGEREGGWREGWRRGGRAGMRGRVEGTGGNFTRLSVAHHYPFPQGQSASCNPCFGRFSSFFLTLVLQIHQHRCQPARRPPPIYMCPTAEPRCQSSSSSSHLFISLLPYLLSKDVLFLDNPSRMSTRDRGFSLSPFIFGIFSTVDPPSILRSLTPNSTATCDTPCQDNLNDVLT